MALDERTYTNILVAVFEELFNIIDDLSTLSAITNKSILMVQIMVD